MYDRIVWDFNGTILDDLQTGIECANILLKRYGKPQIPDLSTYQDLFHFPIQDYYESIGLPAKGEGFVKVAHEWMALYREREKDLPARDGVLRALEEFRSMGIPQTILSATELSQLEDQVGYLGIRHFFDRLLGREDIYATDKSSIAKKYRQEHPNEKVLMVGDTTHDYDTALAGNFDCVFVLGGHHKEDRLKKTGCLVFHSFEELVLWIKSKS